MVSYIIFLLVIAGIYALLAQSLCLAWGVTGLVNLGLAGFFAIGAYASATLVKWGGVPVPLGLVAAMVLPHLLRHVGERTARWLLLTGELIDAAAAERAGLVNAVVPPEALRETALAWCRSLAEGGPKALATTKELLRRCSRQAVASRSAPSGFCSRGRPARPRPWPSRW